MNNYVIFALKFRSQEQNSSLITSVIVETNQPTLATHVLTDIDVIDESFS